MIKVNVLSEEKSWNQKIKKKVFFLITYVNFFQKSLNLIKEVFI